MTARNPSLDVLRGVAILVVIGHHLRYYRVWTQVGWIGVDLFFVLSGFLISGLLFHEIQLTGNLDWRRFMLRRGLKIWPTFYLFTFGMGFVELLRRVPLTFVLKHMLTLALFVQNYAGVLDLQYRSWFEHTDHIWSLCVEEHFYLFLPLLLQLAIKRGNGIKDVPWICTTLAAVCFSMRIGAHGIAYFRGDILSETQFRMDSLFWGVLLRYLFEFHKFAFAKVSSNWALSIVPFCIAPAFFYSQESHFMQGFGVMLLAAGFFVLVAWSVVRQPLKPFLTLGRIGRYSYSIYIIHKPIVDFTRHSNSAFAFWTGMVLSIAVGIAVAKLIEMPVLRLRDRLLPAFPSKPVRAAFATAD